MNSFIPQLAAQRLAIAGTPRTTVIDSIRTRDRAILLKTLHGMEIGAAVGTIVVATRAISKTFPCVRYGWLKQGTDPGCAAQPGYTVRTLAISTLIGTALGMVAGIVFPERKRT